ncbi:uncharacterized protein LOC6545135 [Drosophila erecta]|uniref:peptidylprolyl isomerase n=1 Tax=Drosophila erecta TaxID=7220 RepID=B3NEN2_DROER|nr:uncharacterized protein LOC6545135 [Drosophila erecta]EDV50027.1 uncharacterized protein Dere_GG14671 [Drosophila erecta]
MNLENSAPCKFDIYKIEEVEHGDKEACDESWGCLGSSSKSVDWSDNARSDPYGGFESDSMSMIPASESKSCKLPAGWEERIAANTKESYFYDTISRKVYFTLPPSDHREAERDAWNGSPRCTLRCRHILVKHNESDRCSSYREPVVNRTKREALHKILQTRDLVGSGESEFAALARTISDCCSARHGGDLGPLRLTQTSFGFEENILLLNTPELSEIFQTNAGYHILWRTPVHNRKRNKRGSLEQLINSTKKEPKTHLKKNKYFSMRKPKAFLCNSIGEKQGTRAFDSKSSCPSGFSFKTPCPTLESLAPDDSIIYAKQQCEVRNQIVHDKLDKTMHLGKYLKLLAENAPGNGLIKLQNVTKDFCMNKGRLRPENECHMGN